MNIYFTDFFGVTEEQLAQCGAFNISLAVDLPLFVDPFLLFESKRPEYQNLHIQIIDYLKYLRDLSRDDVLSESRIRDLYCFSEVHQNWLGFTLSGNRGRGLGMNFARALSSSLNSLFQDFGAENVTRGSHLEKLCLIRDGVGRDMISDFCTNLIKDYLCSYTEEFARKNIDSTLLKEVAVERVRFSTEFGRWMPGNYVLPYTAGDYVLLTPQDILTKDETWINKQAYYREYPEIPKAVGNQQLRAQIEGYFRSVLPRDPRKRERDEAIRKTTIKFPELIDYFIRHKENTGADATRRSIEKVMESTTVYVDQVKALVGILQRETDFFDGAVASLTAARQKALFLKDVIENKGGHRLFYHKNKPIKRESDLQIMYRLVWFGTTFDVSREVDDGRGPADYKVSKGAFDKTLVEMKLASNSSLERNLEKQVEVYQRASDAPHAIKIILFFNEQEEAKVNRVLRRLGIHQSEDIILIDARCDNKPSGSKA